MRSTKYESYKFGTIEWSEKIPSHWEIKQLRYICTCEDGKRIPLNSEERSMRQGEYPYWGANSIVDYVDEWLFDEELVLLGEDGAPFLEINKTVSFLSKGKIWPNNHIHVLRPKEPGSGAFIAKALNAVDYSSVITGSTRAKLNQGAMNGIKIPWPSAKERIAIVKFLDHETAKIDALIAEQERLIELLQEKRQAVISHAVTKGLNPNATMKDSGVEWLGEVPEHWIVSKLIYLSEAIGDGLHGTPTYSEDSEIQFINGTNLRAGKIRITDKTQQVQHSDWEQQKIRIGENTLLLSINGTIGNYALHNGEVVMLGKSVAYINCEKDLSREFLSLLIQSSQCQEYFKLSCTGTTIRNLSLDSIRKISIALPSLDEQTEIASCINKESRNLDHMIAASKDAVKLYLERRSALISAAVTGQIDVRGLVADEEAA